MTTRSESTLRRAARREHLMVRSHRDGLALVDADRNCVVAGGLSWPEIEDMLYVPARNARRLEVLQRARKQKENE